MEVNKIQNVAYGAESSKVSNVENENEEKSIFETEQNEDTSLKDILESSANDKKR